jgi:phosphoenolpyruvate carboxykinase (GTP)
MGDYFGHWLDIGEKADVAKLPRIFTVNWFRKGSDGRWLWPGFGENSRVLAWVFDRCEDRVAATDTPVGRLPVAADLQLDGLDLADDDLTELLRVDPDVWEREAASIEDHLDRFEPKMPAALRGQLQLLRDRLAAARS